MARPSTAPSSLTLTSSPLQQQQQQQQQRRGEEGVAQYEDRVSRSLAVLGGGRGVEGGRASESLSPMEIAAVRDILRQSMHLSSPGKFHESSHHNNGEDGAERRRPASAASRFSQHLLQG